MSTDRPTENTWAAGSAIESRGRITAIPVPDLPDESDPFEFEELDRRRPPEPREPVRAFAGFCGSCDGPIDAITGECRCSG